MRILLINPFGTEQDGFSNPPLGLLYLAGTLLKHGFEVELVDGCLDGRDVVQASISRFKPNMVGITCLTPNRKKALEVAQMVKDYNRDILVVLGGAHPTIMYNQIMESYPVVDYVVLGEGEAAFLEIAQGKELSQINGLVYRDNGNITKTAARKNIENLDDIPFPAWQLVDFKRYPSRGEGVHRGINLASEARVSVIFSRGCKGHCDFCSTWWIWKGWRHRSPKNMTDEIELLNKKYGVKHFCFADDAMTVNRQATIELCDEIIARRLNIAFHVTTRTDCVDEIVLRKLKKAGCYNIAFGIETGSPELLKRMGKENDVATSERAIQLCKKIGIKVTALLIIGNVGETKGTVSETVRFLRKNLPDEMGCVGGLWVLPGTKVYQQCKRQGTINDDFWLKDEPYQIYTMDFSKDELAQLQKDVSAYHPVSNKLKLKLAKFLNRLHSFVYNYF